MYTTFADAFDDFDVDDDDITKVILMIIMIEWKSDAEMDTLLLPEKLFRSEV